MSANKSVPYVPSIFTNVESSGFLLDDVSDAEDDESPTRPLYKKLKMMEFSLDKRVDRLLARRTRNMPKMTMGHSPSAGTIFTQMSRVPSSYESARIERKALRDSAMNYKKERLTKLHKCNREKLGAVLE